MTVISRYRIMNCFRVDISALKLFLATEGNKK